MVTTAGWAQHKDTHSRTASKQRKEKHTSAADCTACSWACQLFQRLAVGQDGLGEARLSCPELLYRESQTEACAEAKPASTHTWLAATAQQRPLRALPDLVGMCTFRTPSTPVSLNFPVPKQTMFTTLLLCLHHSLGHLIYKNILL